jgi:hypothetical protein
MKKWERKYERFGATSPTYSQPGMRGRGYYAA